MASGPRFVSPYFYAFDPITGLSEGVPGALLNFYLTNSDTPSPVYADMALTISLGPQVEADEHGIFPDIFIDPTITYKVVHTGPDDGITAPIEFWTADPYKLAWATSQTTFFDKAYSWPNSAPTLNEPLAIYTAARPQRFPGNFDGTADGIGKAWGNIVTAPTAELIVWCYFLDVTPVGYMRIATDKTVDFFTDGGNPFDLDTGEFITWRAATADATAAIIGWTTPGLNL